VRERQRKAAQNRDGDWECDRKIISLYLLETKTLTQFAIWIWVIVKLGYLPVKWTFLFSPFFAKFTYNFFIICGMGVGRAKGFGFEFGNGVLGNCILHPLYF